MSEVKKLGLPAKVKKGKSSWKPASITEVTNKEDGYRYRWSNKSADNIAKKEAEGWTTVSGLIGDKVKPADDGKVHTGANLSSTYEKHDVILQRIPEEDAQERDRYHDEKNERRTAGLTSHLKKEIREQGGNAPVHGGITISSRSGERVID